MNYNLDEILDGYDNESDVSEEEKRYQSEENEKEQNQNGNNIKKDTGKDNLWKEVFSWVRIIVGAFIVAFILSNFVIVNARVPSGSMISTINENDKLIDDHTLVALTIMIAESRPEEKEMMISVIMNCIKT